MVANRPVRNRNWQCLQSGQGAFIEVLMLAPHPAARPWESCDMKGIRRLAQHLDISIGTVSRALNGKPDVNEQTRQRVLEAAAAMGYVPNQAGRALRKGST